MLFEEAQNSKNNTLCILRVFVKNDDASEWFERVCLRRQRFGPGLISPEETMAGHGGEMLDTATVSVASSCGITVFSAKEQRKISWEKSRTVSRIIINRDRVQFEQLALLRWRGFGRTTRQRSYVSRTRRKTANSNGWFHWRCYSTCTHKKHLAVLHLNQQIGIADSVSDHLRDAP